MFTEVVKKLEERVLESEVPIPDNVSVNYVSDRENLEKMLIVKGPLGEVKRDLSRIPVQIKVEGRKLLIRVAEEGKEGKALLNTIVKMINNMFVGVTKGYVYKMKAYYVHFPMDVEVVGNEVIIKNFAGERGIRKAKICPGVKVEVVKEGTELDIVIKGVDKEAVGQTAANIYLATKVRRKDPRVFLDGIYVYYKGVGMHEA